MDSQRTACEIHPYSFHMDKATPIRIVLASLLFIYILHYPLSQLLPDVPPIPQYEWGSWLLAYGFVSFSSTIFIPALYFGMSGRPPTIFPIVAQDTKVVKRLSLIATTVVFSVFALWSYLMVIFKIGMTIYADFEPLPFRLTGILFYGRLLVQPIVLAYIAINYSSSKLKWLIFLMMFALGAWVAVSSGSRLAALVFALPIVLLFKNKTRYFAFAICLSIYIIIASRTRTLYLPNVIGDIDILSIYGSELAQEQDNHLSDTLLLPIKYIADRTLGIRELLATLSFGDVAISLQDAAMNFLSTIFPFIESADSISYKLIMGGSEDDFGGIGLDLFSMIWVKSGGSHVFFPLSLLITGWMLGKTFRNFATAFERFGVQSVNILVFVPLFIVIMIEGRSHLLAPLLIVSWIFSKDYTVRKIRSLVDYITHASRI